ncbi:hypothetical protein GC194_15300, partial [bacterium]|nr:hypothetical protein [bacterium]
MTVHNIHNKKSVSGVILLLVIFQLQFGVAQSRYDFCTNEGILQFKPNGSMTFNQVNLKPKGLIPIFPKGILLRSASGRAQFIGPYLNQAVDSCVFYNVPGNYFSTVLHKKDANNLVIFPVSSSEYAIVFTRRYKFYAPLYQSNGNGLYYDIYNESTGKMKFGGNGKVIATGTFDIYSSASQAAATTVDIFQKSSKNYDYWLLAHNRDSICVFSFSKDSIYMSDVHLKNSTEYFIDAKPQDGLNKLGVLHNRNLVFSATGKYIVYQQVHQVLQLTSKDTVSAELENSVSLLHFDLQRGTIGASQTIDSDHFFDKVQYNPNPDRFSPFLLSQYELIAEGRALFSDNDSFLFYYKARIEKHPENTAPDIERYRVILRFNLKDSKAKPDSIVVDRYFSDMLWAPDRNIYAIRNFNPKAKLVRVDLPTRHDGNKLRIDTNALLESPKFWGNSFSWFFQEKYYPEIKYSSGCNMDTIIVENQSHPYFIHFKWHLKYRGKTIVIDTTASNLRFVPKTGGSYHLIFTAWRTKGQEKTIDTIIDVIKPPKAAIRIDSIISCAHKQINFFDASVSDTTNAKTGAMWNWRFVKDGVLKKTSKNKNPHISFSNEGNYKISLVYSNGFCMDTARYIDPLYILKAPKAGFNLSDTIACATAYISATSLDSGSVSKRFFLLNDKVKSTDSVWQLVIDSSGYYKITQILTGPTGCTTRDSAYVRIRPGFTKNDSTALLYATVLDSERVQLK